MKRITAALVIVMIALVAFVFYAGHTTQKEQVKMTPEEYQAYRESFISRYEVLSVFQYPYQRTNAYGGVQGIDICYAFTYIDGSGTLHSVERFQHLEYGLTKIRIGEADQYVIDRWGEEHRYLCLTEETLQSMRTSAVQ